MPEGHNIDLAVTWADSGILTRVAAFGLGACVDADFHDTGVPLPPAVILDYMYGVAAYKRWGTMQGRSVVESYYLEHYAQIPAPPRRPPSDYDSNPPSDESDSPNKPPQRRYRSSKKGEPLGEAMDRLNLVMMRIHGITPEDVANRREKEEEEEELKAQEASRSKVMDWMNSADDVGGS
jgi:hypothetical protein